MVIKPLSRSSRPMAISDSGGRNQLGTARIISFYYITKHSHPVEESHRLRMSRTLKFIKLSISLREILVKGPGVSLWPCSLEVG